MRKPPEEWKIVRLGEIVSFKNGKSCRLGNDGIYPIYGSNGLIGFQSDYYLDGTFILVGRVGASGEVHLASGKFWVSDNCLIGMCYNFTISTFIYHLLKYMDLKKFISQTAQPLITQSFINSLQIFLPPLPEQHKIADILETADKAIEKTDAIIEKYRRIKQGLMQDLLTKGIDENGLIRNEDTHKFKDSPLGRIPEEWEVVRLGEVATVKKDKEIPSKKLPYIGLENIESNTGKLLDIIDASTIKGIANIFNAGDVLFGKLRPNLKKFHYARMEGFCSTEILVIIPIKSSLMDTIFLHLIVQSPAFLKLAEAKVFGTKMPRTSWDILKRFVFPLPPLPEQHRIASILSQIDEVIEKEERYKEKLERIKQGLMQDLLTGKVRVNYLIKET